MGNAITASTAEVNGRIDDTNQVIADNKAEQALTDADQDAITAANKQEAAAANAATNQVVADNKTAQATTDAGQNTVIAANKQEATTANAATNDRITNEATRQDDINAGQDTLISQNTQTITANKQEAAAANAATNQVVADNKAAQATTDAGQNTVITANKQEAASANAATNQIVADNKAEQTITDAGQNTVIATNNTNINNKVDTAVIDLTAKNVSQDDAISKNTQVIASNKVAQATIDAAQDVTIASKVSQQDFIADQVRQDEIIAGKADLGYVDSQNAQQNVAIDKNTKDTAINTGDIAGLKASDVAIGKKIDTNNTTINNRVDKVVEVQADVDAEQNRLIALNNNRFNGLDERVNNLDKTLSSGISSALAIASMPTMSIAGAHMITGGSGYYNGQGSMAVGLTGTSDTGKVSYKIGGSYTDNGGSAFSIGGGYRWK